MRERIPTIGNILLCFFELLVGIVLLIHPEKFTTAIIIVLGIALMVMGIISIVKYFRLPAEDAANGQHMMKGLTFLLGGAFCVFNSQWFLAMFPIITIIYGVIMLLCGLEKIQLTVDMLRVKRRKWYFEAISAVASIACAVVILCNLFKVVSVLWIFTGIALIVEAVLDIVVIVMNMLDKPKTDDAEQIQQATGAEMIKSEGK